MTGRILRGAAIVITLGLVITAIVCGLAFAIGAAA
jgi:hypothetical protein